MKRCGHCKRELELSLFQVDTRAKSGYSSWCRDCKREASRRYYAKEGSAGKLRNQLTYKARRSLKQRFVAMLGGKCSRCGYDEFIGALDFHHVDSASKDHEIARLLTVNRNNIAVIEAELTKCVLLCKNCHAFIHWGYHES